MSDTIDKSGQAEPKKGYGLHNVTVTTYREAGAALGKAFEALVLTLTPELDDEDGPDTLNWVKNNNALFPAGGPYDTFIFSDTDSGEVLGTITFTPDDRDALKDNDITAFGVIGFFNVLRRDLRGSGLGSFIGDFLDGHIRGAAAKTGSVQDVCLFTADPSPYSRWGFTETYRTIPFLGHEEHLCVKSYN